MGASRGAAAVRAMLTRLGAVFQQAVDDGLLYRNPVTRVGRPAQPPKREARWTTAEARAFLAQAAAERLYAAYRLSAFGLRRGEVCGLRWDRIDLAAGILIIPSGDDVTRTMVGSKVITKNTKSRRSVRTLPLDGETVAALVALHDLQAIEAMDAGEAYSDSGYVVVDELGAPLVPNKVRKRVSAGGQGGRCAPYPAARRAAHRQQPHG
jgi:integrase